MHYEVRYNRFGESVTLESFDSFAKAVDYATEALEDFDVVLAVYQCDADEASALRVWSSDEGEAIFNRPTLPACPIAKLYREAR